MTQSTSQSKQVPRTRGKREAIIDRATYGGSPGAAFLADLLNIEIEAKKENIGTVVRKYGHLLEGLNVTLNSLERAFERDVMDVRTVNHLLGLEWNHVKRAMTGLREELVNLDPRIANLMSNVLAGSYKTFARRLYAFNIARLRQRALKARLARGIELDDVYDKDTGVPLYEDGELVRLSFRDFYSDREEKHEYLWSRAKSVEK